jgi:hypothetical protein
MSKLKRTGRYCQRLAKRKFDGGVFPIRHIPDHRSFSEKYFLAAADQASGTRDERLAKVIKAKYEAGLLKPYDYSRGYAKMYKWLEKKWVGSGENRLSADLGL